MEFSANDARYIVSIKSGPNWGNSSQVARLKDNFTNAARLIRQGNRTANVIAVNGCCYGRDNNPDKGGYFKYCGQEFWELISGDAEFYTRIIEPLGHNARQRNRTFAEQYGAVVNRLSQEFTAGFCTPDGSIDWPKLVAFSSAKGGGAAADLMVTPRFGLTCSIKFDTITSASNLLDKEDRKIDSARGEDRQNIGV